MSSDHSVIEIVQLLVSPVHRYEGRPADGPLPAPDGEVVKSVQVRAGLGLVGDRYYNRRAHRTASVTMMALESLGELPPGTDLRQTRRNVLLRGYDVDALAGRDFSLDSGTGAVDFRAHRPANPCAWMDSVIGAGSRSALKGRGGVRCEPLGDGTLRVGAVTLRVVDA